MLQEAEVQEAGLEGCWGGWDPKMMEKVVSHDCGSPNRLNPAPAPQPLTLDTTWASRSISPASNGSCEFTHLLQRCPCEGSCGHR